MSTVSNVTREQSGIGRVQLLVDNGEAKSMKLMAMSLNCTIIVS